MARFVAVTIVYDMDDPQKTLASERQDWIDGHVDAQDVIALDDYAITIRALSPKEAADWNKTNELVKEEAR